MRIVKAELWEYGTVRLTDEHGIPAVYRIDFEGKATLGHVMHVKGGRHTEVPGVNGSRYEVALFVPGRFVNEPLPLPLVLDVKELGV